VVINPVIVDGQVRGGVTQGVAAALLEHLAVESERRLPDARTFGPRAESLVALLAAVA